MEIKVKHRHGFWQRLIRPFVYQFILRNKFNYTYEKCKIKPPFVVLGNHTTDYDAFFMSASFNHPIYFVMSDHISSLKVGKIIEHLVSPIPITKSTHDVGTVRNIMSVIKQGACVGIFPEGNKSFAGEMSEMKPSIGKLLKKLNVPVVIYNIHGGYFSSPRWTKVKRKGHVHGFVKRILSPEELKNLSSEEIYEIVKDELRVNAYEVQEKEMQKFGKKKLAENIETLLYLCPKCHALSSLASKGNELFCTKCDYKASFNEYGYVFDPDRKRLDQMDKQQKEYIKTIDFSKFHDKPITSDGGFIVKLKIDKFTNKDLGNFSLELYNDKFRLVGNREIDIPLSEVIGYAIEGINGIQLSLKDGKVLRLNNPNNVSGLKYVNLFCAIKNEPYKF